MFDPSNMKGFQSPTPSVKCWFRGFTYARGPSMWWQTDREGHYEATPLRLLHVEMKTLKR